MRLGTVGKSNHSKDRRQVGFVGDFRLHALLASIGLQPLTPRRHRVLQLLELRLRDF